MKTSSTNRRNPSEHYKTLEMEIVLFMLYYMHKSKFMLSKIVKEMVFYRRKGIISRNNKIELMEFVLIVRDYVYGLLTLSLYCWLKERKIS